MADETDTKAKDPPAGDAGGGVSQADWDEHLDRPDAPPESEWVEGSPPEEDVELAAEDQAAHEPGPLFGGPVQAVISRPPWLVDGPPKTSKKRWPGGARSATWLKRLRKCPRNHAQRYRYRKPDPSGFPAKVGGAVHDVLDWACKRRLWKRYRGLSATVSVDEMLHLLEFHAVARRSPEVLERAREIVIGMGAVDFSRAVASELLVQYRVTHAFHLAGYVDLVEIEGDPDAPDLVIATDYKTGQTVLTPEEMFRDEQVGLYLVAINNLYPKARRIIFRMWYVALGYEMKIPYSRHLQAEFLSRARAGANIWSARDETATPEAGYCNQCPYRNDCVALSTSIARSRMLPAAGSVAALSLPEKMRRYRESKIAEKNAIARAKDLGKLILQDMGSRQDSYRAGRFLATKKRKPVTIWDSEGETLVAISKAVDIPIASIIDQLGKGIGSKKINSWVNSLGDGYREKVETIIAARRKQTGGAAHVVVTESKSIGKGKTKVRLPF